jgi:hypothetical protein
MLFKAYNDKIRPAEFDVEEYNNKAVQMFYKQIEEA